MTVYYEVWADAEDGSGRRELYYKFPVPSPEQEEEVGKFAGKTIAEDNRLVNPEVKRVEE
jgi:hypothetical protein